MRFTKISAALLAFAFLSAPTFAHGAVGESFITGRFILDNSEFTCNHCVVTLLGGGVRPVATALLDMSGTFVFNHVPPGAYTIHADLDGFEPVNQEVDASDIKSRLTLMISLVRKRVVQSSDPKIVDVSELTDRYPKKAVSLFEKGSDSLKNKKTNDAIKYLQNAVELAPTFYAAHNQLGIALREAGRDDEAEVEFRKAHELNSTAVEPLLNLTGIYLDHNEPDRAVAAGEEAVKVNSRSGPAFFSLGIALYKAAMLDRAETALRRALELAPKLSTARLVLANVYLKLQRYDNTLEQLNKYIFENPDGDQRRAALQLRDELLKAKVVQAP
jgi:tetratricopeptide (TPR) repeat protein